MGEGVEEVVGGGPHGLAGPVRVGGAGARPAQAVAGRADGQRRRRQLHVGRRRRVVVRELDGAQLLQLALQAAVLLRERLAAALEELAVHLRLLQLRPAGAARTR